jgi:hypothetical protein
MSGFEKLTTAFAPSTPKEWAEWLSTQEAKTRAVYMTKPTLLIADHYRELAISRDYEGREILELLQNANDAAAEAGAKGRVVIELSRDGLVVANTGVAFSTGGVESLQTSHLSPKRRNKRVFIGNKGLGFRAILNWSRTPIILSGPLRLAYSQRLTESKLAALLKESAEIAQLIADERCTNSEYIAPLLAFPAYSENGQLASFVEGTACNILERCENLVSQGYATAIGMPFDRAEAFVAATEQLLQLRPEILLFSEWLSEIRICGPKGEEHNWKRDRCDKQGQLVAVLDNDASIGEWKVWREIGTIPAELVESDKTEEINYEIVVAVPMGFARKPSTLFSYFPTEVMLPLPIVCHATLELEQNRKHPQTGPSNRFVLDRLADFITEVAERFAVERSDLPWAGCDLLTPLGDFPSDLASVNFAECMFEAARKRSLIPILGGQQVSADKACLVPGADASWLPVAVFDNVVPIREAKDLQFLAKLEVPSLQAKDFSERLSSASALSLDERAALIEGMIKNNLSKDTHSPTLLVDTSGNAIPSDTRVFLTSSAGGAPSVPSWMDLRFLNEGLRAQLAQRLDTRDARDLQGKLSSFGVVEYSLDNLVRGLVAAANRQIKAEPDHAAEYDRELLRVLFDLFPANIPASKRPHFPEESTVRLLNQLGKLVPASDLYMGDGYGRNGTITQALFQSCAREKLVATPDHLYLEGEAEAIREFLKWIGVAVWPRTMTEQRPDPDYCRYLLQKITYPARFDDYMFVSANEVTRSGVERVISVDGIDEILQRADPVAILGWFANDDRLQEWQRLSSQHAALYCRPGQTWNHRYYRGPIASYIRWVIESRVWLPLESGGVGRPSDCLLGERAIETLFPRPARPPQSLLEKYGFAASDLWNGWIRAGVVPSLAYLERDEIYRRLIELPERNPSGQAARSLYRWLLDTSDTIGGVQGSSCNDFMNRGRMWGRRGSECGYFPISELRHVDADGIPEPLLARLTIVDLPMRVGAEKVERLFGVQAVDRSRIEQELRTLQLAVGSVAANNDFEEAKPFLYKLRQSQTAQTQNLRILKELRLEVCSELAVTMKYEGEAFEYDVPVWGWVIVDRVLYVRTDPADAIEISPSLLADSIGAALASLFRLGDGGEFARMLLCKPKDRRVLLLKMRGEGSDSDLETVGSEFALNQVDWSEATWPQIISPPATSAASTSTISTLDGQDPNVESQQAAIPGDPPELQPISISEELHTPSGPPVRQSLRIQTVGGGSGGEGYSHRITDGPFCERKALEFEESDDPQRFPLFVSQLTGYDAPGCDILSFASEVDRQAFMEGQERDPRRVVRFIEVKGRADSTATIELKGNELTAAERYGGRYFLYRFYEATDDTFVLTVLQDPLSHKNALQSVVHVSLDRADTARKFRLVGGIRQEQ